jgi:hypothetical protein
LASAGAVDHELLDRQIDVLGGAAHARQAPGARHPDVELATGGLDGTVHLGLGGHHFRRGDPADLGLGGADRARSQADHEGGDEPARKVGAHRDHVG